MKAALYARVSTDEQALYGDSLRMQLDTLNDFAKRNFYEVVGTYIDDGYTATNLKRPNLQQLLNDVRAGNIDIILFVKIDRWSRGVRNYYKLQDILDENKVHWKAVLEDYDTTTTAGRLQINIMLTIAENESSVTSDRIKAVFKNKLEQGEVISGNTSLGYKIKDKRLVVDESEREIVQDIFNQYEAIMSINRLARNFKDKYEGLTYRRLKSILSNRIYTGIHTSDYGTFQNYCEPIISVEQFDRVQRLIELNAKVYKSTRKKTDYVFSKIINCGDCGIRMSGNTRKGSKRNRPGYVQNVYRCQRHYKNHTCKNNYNITEKKLEEYLLENVKKLLEQYILEIEVKKQKPKKKPEIDVAKINNKLDKLRDLYLDDMINKVQYKEEFDRLNAILAQSSNDIVEPEVDTKAIEEFLKLDIDKIYITLSPIERRRLWLSVIKEIRVTRNSIDVEFI